MGVGVVYPSARMARRRAGERFSVSKVSVVLFVSSDKNAPESIVVIETIIPPANRTLPGGLLPYAIEVRTRPDEELFSRNGDRRHRKASVQLIGRQHLEFRPRRDNRSDGAFVRDIDLAVREDRRGVH